MAEPSKHHRRTAILLAGCLALAACVPDGPAAPANGQASVPAGGAASAPDTMERGATVKLLTYPARANVVHQATGMQGVLVARGGCLMMRADEIDYLLYVPRGMLTLESGGGGLVQDGVRIPIGGRIALDGTGYRNPGNLTMLDDPGTCDAAHVFVAFPGRIRLL